MGGDDHGVLRREAGGDRRVVHPYGERLEVRVRQEDDVVGAKSPVTGRSRSSRSSSAASTSPSSRVWSSENSPETGRSASVVRRCSALSAAASASFWGTTVQVFSWSWSRGPVGS